MAGRHVVRDLDSSLLRAFGKKLVQWITAKGRRERQAAIDLQPLEQRLLMSLAPAIAGAASVDEGSEYRLYVSATGSQSSQVTDWVVNWGTGQPAVSYPVAQLQQDAVGTYLPYTYPDGPVLRTITATAKIGSTSYSAGGLGVDVAFGTHGKVLHDLGGNDNAHAMAVQSDGKILLAGVINGSDFGIVRYNADGSVDELFGRGGSDGDGVASVDFAGSSDKAYAIALQEDGKIIVAGSAYVSGTINFALARLNSNGTKDTSFGSGGKVWTPIGAGTEEAFAVAMQDDGKIVAAGYTSTSGGNNMAVTRFTSSGQLDSTFHGDGIATISFGGTAVAQAVIVQPDQKIIVGGRYNQSGVPDDFALARLNTDGSLDSTFGYWGQVTTDFGASCSGGLYDSDYSLVLQPDGKIIAAGDSNGDFAIARYHSSGSLDVSFDYDGKVSTDFDGQLDRGYAAALQPDGKLVVAGYAGRNASLHQTNFEFGIARYQTYGGLDATFGVGGKLMSNLSALGNHDVARAMAVLSDGRILVGGHSDGNFALARFHPTNRVSVDVVRPTLRITGPTGVEAGQAATWTFKKLADPAPDTVQSWTISWGDGQSDVVTSANVNGNINGTFTLSHTYAAGLQHFTITALVRDEDATNHAPEPLSVYTVVCGPSGYSLHQSGGGATTHGSASWDGTTVTMNSGDSFTTVLRRQVLDAPLPPMLNFQFSGLALNQGNSPIKDAFEIALLDRDGRSLVHTIGDGRSAFYNVTHGVDAPSHARGVLVSSNGALTTVSVDVSYIDPANEVWVEFRLVNDDGPGGGTSSVNVPCQTSGNGRPLWGVDEDDGGELFRIDNYDDPLARSVTPFGHISYYPPGQSEPTRVEPNNADSQVESFTIDASGTAYMAVNRDLSGTDEPVLLSLDLTTATSANAKFIGRIPVSVVGTITDLAFHPITGQFYAIQDIAPTGGDNLLLLSVNDGPTGPFVELVSSWAMEGSGQNVAQGESMAFDARGRLYVMDASDDHLYEVSPRTGRIIDVVNNQENGAYVAIGAASSLQNTKVEGLTVDPVTGDLIASDDNNNKLIRLQFNSDGTITESILFDLIADVEPDEPDLTDVEGLAFFPTTPRSHQSYFAGTLDHDTPVNTVDLVDVTSYFSTTYGRTSFNEQDKVLFAGLELDVIDNAPREIRGPLVLGVRDVSDPLVRLHAAHGVTLDGIAYYDLSSLLNDGQITSADGPLSIDLAFFDPNGAPFTYELVILGQVNRPPEFTSKPTVLTVTVGSTYAYDAVASDPDADAPLTFGVMAGPTNMAFTPGTGNERRLAWTASDVGNHSIVLRVADPSGAHALQEFTLKVVPNSDLVGPRFTSDPTGEAYVNVGYAYEPKVEDGDDPLSNLTLTLLEGFHGLELVSETVNEELVRKKVVWQQPTAAPFTYAYGEHFGRTGDDGGFEPASGSQWSVENGRYTSNGAGFSLTTLSADVSAALPPQFAVGVTAAFDEPTSGTSHNGWVIFDYVDDTNFKFARALVEEGKWQIGSKTPTSGITIHTEYTAVIGTLAQGVSHEIVLAFDHGLVTLFVNGAYARQHDFGVDLRGGRVGLATEDARTRFDDFVIRGNVVAAPQFKDGSATALGHVEDFNDRRADGFLPQSGQWQVQDGRYQGGGSALAVSTLRLESAPRRLPSGFRVAGDVTFAGATGEGLVVFDYVDEDNFKFVSGSVAGQHWRIGERAGGAWMYHQEVSNAIASGQVYRSKVKVDGAVVEFFVDGKRLASHTYAEMGGVTGGALGTVGVASRDGEVSFDDFAVKHAIKVTLEVEDDDGHFATQSYAIRVFPEPGNRDPFFTNKPGDKHRVGSSNSAASGNVWPKAIDLELGYGQSTTVPVTIGLTSTGTIGGTFVPPSIDPGSMNVYAETNPQVLEQFLLGQGGTGIDITSFQVRGLRGSTNPRNFIEPYDIASGSTGFFLNNAGPYTGLSEYGLVMSTGDVRKYGRLDAGAPNAPDRSASFVHVPRVEGMARQVDGKMIVVGTFRGDFLVARYNSDGTLDDGGPTDTTATDAFGINGRVVTDFGAVDGATAVRIQPDGKIVVGGSGNGTFALSRYNLDGSLDVSFGTGGKVDSPIGAGASGDGRDLVLDGAGNIFLAGYAGPSWNADLAVAKYTAAGQLDAAFGQAGITTIDLGANERGEGLVILPDGRLVIGGYQETSGAGDFLLVRLTQNGWLDEAFGDGGRVLTEFGTTSAPRDDRALDLGATAEGEIVLAGYSQGATGSEMALARYDSDGNLDQSFGAQQTGMVLTNPDGIGDSDDFTSALAIDGNKVVLVGHTRGDSRVWAVRYTAAGVLDGTFSDDGIAAYSLYYVPESGADSEEFAADLVLTAETPGDDPFVMVGNANYGVALAGVLANGDSDAAAAAGDPTDFGIKGFSFDTFRSSDESRDFAVLQIPQTTTYSDYNYLAVGSAGGDFALSLHEFDGSLVELGTPERRITAATRTDLGSSEDHAHAIVRDSSGRYLVAGYSGAADANFAVVRYLADLTLDPTFGESGFVLTQLGHFDDQIHDIVVTENHIIAVGHSGGDVAIARYHLDGTPDTSFNQQGFLARDFGSYDRAVSVIVDASGKIVIGGYSGADFLIARFNTDGSLDASFGTAGWRTANVAGHDRATSMAMDSNQRYVLAGRAGSDLGYARFDAEGGLDTAFGSNGIQFLDMGQDEQLNDITIDEQGYIVGAGYSRGNVIAWAAIGRLLPDGNPDVSFSGESSGHRAHRFDDETSYDWYANAVLVHPDPDSDPLTNPDPLPRIVSVGHVRNGRVPGGEFALSRYLYYSDKALPDYSLGQWGGTQVNFLGENATASLEQDLELSAITGIDSRPESSDHYDLTEVEITFNVLAGFDEIKFQAVFGSEEAPEYTDSIFIDGFGILFTSGNTTTNIAMAEYPTQNGTALAPVNIKHPQMGDFPGTELDQLLLNISGGAVLDFSHTVTPGSTGNKLRFIIADASDSAWDTTVFVTALGGSRDNFSLDVFASNSTLDDFTAIMAQPPETKTLNVTFTGDGQGHSYDLNFFDKTNNRILGSIPVTINGGYVYDAEADDLDKDPLQFDLIDGPDGAYLEDPATGVVKWRPMAADIGTTRTFVMRVSDGRGGEAIREFGVHVVGEEPNADPSFQAPLPPSLVTTEAGHTYGHQFHATDSDPNDDPSGDTLRYYVVATGGESVPGLTIGETTGLLTWTPGAAQVRETPYSITVRVLDRRGGFADHTFDVKVSAPNLHLNSDPRFYPWDGPTDLQARETLTHPVKATDQEGHRIKYRLASGPEGLTVSEDGMVVWTPTDFQVGDDHRVVVIAEDERRGSSVTAFHLNVEARPLPPVFVSEAIEQARQGVDYKYRVRAIDPDVDLEDPNPDQLWITLTDAPDGMTVDSDWIMTWPQSWTQSLPLGSRHAVTVSITDQPPDTTPRTWVDQTFEVTIIAAGTNHDPVITSAARAEIAAGYTLAYRLEATDEDGDWISYRVPEEYRLLGMEYDEVNRMVFWTPTLADVDAGLFTFQVEADDGRGGVDTEIVSIDVVQYVQNHDPEIVDPVLPGAVVGQPYRFPFQFSDLDNDAVAWLLDAGARRMTLDLYLGELLWVPTASDLGEHEISISIFDPLGGSDSGTYRLVVRATDAPPRLLSSPPPVAQANAEYVYPVEVWDLETLTDDLTFASSVGWLTFDRASFSYRGIAPSSGSPHIEFTVTDAAGNSDSQAVDLTITSDPAVLTSAPRFTTRPIFDAIANGVYTYRVSAVDADGQALPCSAIQVDGSSQVTFGSATCIGDDVELTWTVPNMPGEVYRVVLAATDPTNQLKAWQSYNVLVSGGLNETPTLESIAPQSVYEGHTFRYLVSADDDQPQRLIYELLNVPAGLEDDISIDSRGWITWNVPTGQALGSVSFGVRVTDPFGATSATQPVQVTVSEDNQAPQVAVWVERSRAAIGSDVQFLIAATDNVGIGELRVSLLDPSGKTRLLAVDARGRAIVRLDAPGKYQLTATAYDLGGRASVPKTVEVLAYDPARVQAPVVEIVDPSANGPLAPSVDLRIKVTTEGTIGAWRLELVSLSSGATRLIASGTGEVDGTQLLPKPLDTTLLADGAYVLRLTAEDELFIAETEKPVTVDNPQLKLGNFNLSFTDLTIPVNGFPVTVQRTYDTLNADRKGDFGYGWTLSILEMSLDVDVAPSGLEDFDIYTPFADGQRLTFTLAGGATESFTFLPEPMDPPAGSGLGGMIASNLLFNQAGLRKIAFVPDVGVTSTLRLTRKVTVADLGDGTYADPSGVPFNPASGKYGMYVLTTPDGLEHFIDPETGRIAFVRDLNGNRLNASARSIVAEDAEGNVTGEIVIEREGGANGVIKSVTDPAGRKIVYGYDPDTGDLISVTNRENETTEYFYLPANQRPHFLDEIRVEGVSVLNADFDADGRLIGLIDAANNSATFNPRLNRDDGTFVQRAEDAEDGFTEVQLDARGNVLRRMTRIDEGGTPGTLDDRWFVTVYRYDPNDNQIGVSKPVRKVGDTDRFGYDPDFNVKQLWESRSVYENGLPTEVSDARGDTTYYTYDRLGNPETITDAAGGVTVNKYGRNGNLEETTNPEGEKSIYRYDGSGNLETIVQVRKDGTEVSSSSFVYENGRMVSVTDASNVTRHFRYDANGNQTLSYHHWMDDPSNPTVVKAIVMRTDYDAEGRALKTSQYIREGTKQQYDLGQLDFTSSDDLNGDTPLWFETTVYDAFGRVESSKDRFGTETRNHYDIRGNLTETATQAKNENGVLVWIVTRTFYNANGEAIATTDPYVATSASDWSAADAAAIRITHTIYDDLGRVKETQRLSGVQIVVTPHPVPEGYTGPFNATFDDVASATVVSTTTTAYYDENEQDGRVKSTTSADGLVTYYRYDEVGRQSQVVYALDVNQSGGALEQDPPDADGVPTGGPDVVITTYEYDNAGRQKTVTDALGHKVTYEYDKAGRVRKTIFPDQTFTETVYDDLGRKVADIDQLGRRTDYEYDAQGRLTAVVQPLVTIADPASPSEQIDVHPRYEYGYDQYGNQTSIVTSAYMTADRATVVYLKKDETTGADMIGSSRAVTSPQNHDGLTGSQATITRFAYDHLGRQLTRTLPMGQVETFQYDPDFGHQTLHVTFEGKVAEFGYDNTPGGGGRLTQKRYFDSLAAYNNGQGAPTSTVSYTYDAFGRVRTIVEGTRTWSYAYDVEGRASQVVAPETGAVNYDYDQKTGLLKRTYTADTDTRYAYDKLGRLLRVTLVERNNAAVAGPQADWFGEVITGESTTYRYDQVGNLDVVKQSRTDLTDGLTLDYTYDELNRLKQVTHFYDQDGDLVLDTGELRAGYAYDLNADGSRRKATEQVFDDTGTLRQRVFHWGYDALNRLVSEVLDSDEDANDYIATYQLDLVGNRLKKERDEAVTAQQIQAFFDPAIQDVFNADTAIAYRYDANDRLRTEVTDAPSTENDTHATYEYGPGNAHTTQTKKTVRPGTGGTGDPAEETVFAYDHRGRLAAVTRITYGQTTSVKTSTYAYDDAGIRVEQTVDGQVTHYVIDANNHTGYAQVLEEKDSGGVVTKTYTLGHDVIAQQDPDTQGGEPLVLLYDGHGSTRALSTTAGALVQRYAYDAYGNMLSGTGLTADAKNALTSFHYSGEQTDTATGLQYLRARYYDPSTGRFNRLDSFPGDAQAPESLHKYLYANGSPTTGTDPSGYFTVGLVGTLATIGGAGALQSALLPRATAGWRSGQSFQWYLFSHGYGFASPLIAEHWEDPMSRALVKALMEVESFLNPPGGPGFWEGMIPVWGSGRTAGAHLANGRLIAGSFLAIVAALEVSGIPVLARLLMSKASQYLAKEGAGLTAESVLAMAKSGPITPEDCVARAIAYDAARTGRLVPAVIPVPASSLDVIAYAGRLNSVLALDSAELVSQLSRYADGAGGIVMAHRGPGIKGHAFNWEIIGGKPRLWDPQLGDFAQLEGGDYLFFTWVSTGPVY